MNDIYVLLACMGAGLCWAAWREHRGGNQRDTILLAACGTVLTMAGTACVLLL